MAPQNPLTTHGNDKTMNLNSLILTNIQSSPYFKVNLYELKTYHEVIDEIYFKVGHLEPWEKGSRKTAGQTGMCGGVRGVGAGGIVSSAYCLLYKLFTLKLTKKQVIGLITHVDSPYIRGLGFMFIRYTQPPGDLWDWYVDYLEDEEEIDVKAGGGHTITIGEMVRQFLTKLEWYSTLFPRIPVPIQKDIQKKMMEWEREHGGPATTKPEVVPEPVEEEEDPSGFGEAERISQLRSSPRRGREGAKSSPPFDISKEIEHEKDKHEKDKHEKDRQKDSKDRDRHRHRDSRDKERHRESRDNERHRDPERHKDRHRDHRRKSPSRDKRRSRSPRDRKERSHRSRSKERRRSRSRDRKERSSPVRSRDHHKKSSHRERERRDGEDSFEREHHKKSDRDRYEREDSYERDLRREKARQKSEKNGY